MIFKQISLLLISWFFIGCASTERVNFKVTSEPPGAPIEVDGYSLGNTPNGMFLEYRKVWVGLANSPDGWGCISKNFTVRVLPPKGMSGESQTKIINPCSWKGEGMPELKFDLNLRQVEPVKRIEILNENRENQRKASDR